MILFILEDNAYIRNVSSILFRINSIYRRDNLHEFQTFFLDYLNFQYSAYMSSYKTSLFLW